MKRNLPVLSVLVMGMMLLTACGGSAAYTAPTEGATAKALVYPPAATESGTTALGGPGQTVTVTVRGFQLSPKALTIKKGTTVKWTNQGEADYTVTSDDGKTFNNGLPVGDSFTFIFEA